MFLGEYPAIFPAFQGYFWKVFGKLHMIQMFIGATVSFSRTSKAIAVRTRRVRRAFSDKIELRTSGARRVARCED
jgi:hypothetical protein